MGRLSVDLAESAFSIRRCFPASAVRSRSVEFFNRCSPLAAANQRRLESARRVLASRYFRAGRKRRPIAGFGCRL